MNKIKNTLIASALIGALVFAFSEWSTARVDKNTRLRAKLRKADIVDLVNVGFNNWNYVMRNQGSYFYDAPNGNPGGEFPRGSGNTIVFAAGLYVGTLKDGVPVVSETEFATEFQPGRIENSDVSFDELTAEDPARGDLQVYLIDRSASGSDYSNWPADAPKNSFGLPALIADAQTWAVFNDLDVTLSQEGTSISPDPGLGLEVVLESFAFSAGPLSDVVYCKFTIKNKTNVDYADSYLGMWMDADVDANNAGNDIVGVDTVRGLGFVYNADNTDFPGAVGFDFLQGPVVDTTTVSPQLVNKFRNNRVTLVYNAAENRYIPTTLPGNQIWLGATSFNTYANGTDPQNNEQRYNLLAGLFADGNPKAGTGVNDYYAFRGDPVTGLPAADVATSADQADQRILHGVGPFTIVAGSSQEVWVGIVGAQGTDRLNAIVNMRSTDDLAQTTFEAGLVAPAPPDVPKITVVALDGRVSISWQNNSEFSNDIAGSILGIDEASGDYDVSDDNAPAGGFDSYLANDFQGYRVYKSRTGLPGSFTMLADYDKVDGFGVVRNIVLNTAGRIEIEEIEVGTNTGLRYNLIDTDVINSQTYFYSVTAYDAQPYISNANVQLTDPIIGTINQPSGLPISLETAPTSNVVSVIPMPAMLGQDYNAVVSDVTHTGPSDGSVVVEIADPTKVRSVGYSVSFFEIPIDCTGAPLVGITPGTLGWRISSGTTILAIDSRVDDPGTFYDVNGNGQYNAGTDVVLDDRMFGIEQASAADPTTQAGVVVDGMRIVVFGPALGLRNIEITANNAGPLSPTQPGAYTFAGFPTPDTDPTALGPDGDEQALSAALWGLHTAEAAATVPNGDYNDFITRSIGWNNIDGLLGGFADIVPDDIEFRFTAAGSVAGLLNTTGTMNVPFEVWNVTRGFRLIPTVLDDNGNGIYDFRSALGVDLDHEVSGGLNDPMTERIYVYAPVDQSAGEGGYNAWVASGTGGSRSAAFFTVVSNSVIGRLGWVGRNAGNVTTNGPYVGGEHPEEGSIYKITSTKPNGVVDQFAWTGTARATTLPKSTAKASLKDIRAVPNPYYAQSTYQTQGLFNKVLKFTHLPGSCTIRIFNVAGDLITTLAHNASSTNGRRNTNPLDINATASPGETSEEWWNLTNADGKFVASGMYIALIDVPGVGKKTVKFAVIQEANITNGPEIR